MATITVSASDLETLGGAKASPYKLAAGTLVPGTVSSGGEAVAATDLDGSGDAASSIVYFNIHQDGDEAFNGTQRLALYDYVAGKVGYWGLSDDAEDTGDLSGDKFRWLAVLT